MKKDYAIIKDETCGECETNEDVVYDDEYEGFICVHCLFQIQCEKEYE